MVTQQLDVTATLNAAHSVVIDVSGWDYAVIQTVNPSGTLALTATNNDTGTDATDAANFTGILATKLVDNSAVANVSAAGLYRVIICAKYLAIGGTSAAADLVLVQLQKVC